MNSADDDNRSYGPVYEDRILAFFDILGFSERVEASVKDDDRATEILGLLTSLDNALPKFQSETMSITLFSDNICVSSHKPPNFTSFCCGLSMVVTSLLGRGYPVRGAVVRGPLYHKGNVIFGPGLVRAVGLEKHLAIFPRVIIDPLLEPYSTDPDDKFLRPVYEDHDGILCLNFLSPVLLSVVFRLLNMPTEHRIAEILSKIDELLSATSDQVALQKLRWLRAYAKQTLTAPKPDGVLIEELVRRARQAPH
jgi:hypothetical protein